MRTGLGLALGLVAVLGCSSGEGAADVTGPGDAACTDCALPDVATESDATSTDAFWWDGVTQNAGLSNGQAELRVTREPFQIVLSYAGQERVVLPALLFGTTSAYKEETNYDPYWFYRALDGKPAEKPPAGFARTSVVGFTGEPSEVAGGGMRLRLQTEAGHRLLLTAVPEGEAGFALDLVPDPESPTDLPVIVTTSLQWPMAEGENFYGSGERFDTVALRGTFCGLQFEALASESAYNEAHVPVPFVVSTNGYGVYVEEPRPGILDFGTIEADQARLEFMHDALKVHLFLDDTPLDIVGAYTAVSGRPNIPAWWAFAPQQWRNEVNGVADVMDDAAKAREVGVPVGVIWIDRPWEKTYHDFTFNPTQFPDPQAMLDDLRQMGFRVVTWTAPYQTPASDVYAQFESEGLFVERPAGWPTASYSDEVQLVDFTNPRAGELWTGLMRRVTDIGVEGFKFDYGEDVQVGIMGKRTRFSFFNGEDERTMHHRYALFWHRVAHDILGHGKGFLMARAGLAGGQAIVNSIWPGDMDNDFSYRLEVVDGQPMTGGLPNVIRASLSLSASGYPIFSSDTGGFRNGRPTKEVLLRWVEHTALTPVLQFGGGGSTHNPWDFAGKGDEAKYDQETLDVFRRYAVLHMDLFPYVFSYAVAASKTGIPIQRPFGLQEPADGRHPNDQYFFGEQLYVAPVERAETTKTVELPPGTWLDWWTDEVVEGPTTFERPAPLDTLPLYVRAGSVVPLLAPGVQTLSNNPELDPAALAPTDLVLRARVTLGGSGDFVLYDEGSFELRPDAVSAGSASVRFVAGAAFRHAELEVVAPTDPIGQVFLALEGGTPEALDEVADLAAWSSCAAGCWTTDPATGHLFVRAPSDVEGYTVTLAP